MKALLVIFAIYISYVLCEGSKVAVKSFPKKVRPYGNGKILINSAKYEFKAKPKPTTRSQKKMYTVFQVVGIPKAVQGVPDSPYFPVDQGYDHKPRVKKVLPDYPWSSIRSKRSAVFNVSQDEQDEKKIETTITENKQVSKLQTTIETTTMATTVANLDNEKPKEKKVRKSATTVDEDIEVKKEVKEETKSIIQTKTETTIADKPIERSGKTQTSTKKSKVDSKTDAKKDDPKKAQTNKKPQPKSNGQGNGKSKNADTLKSHIRALSESRAAAAKGKSSVATNTERPLRTKSNPKENSTEATTVKLKSKGKEAITNKTSTKGISKDKEKNASATTVKAKPKGKTTKRAVPNFRSKDNVKEKNVKNKKNDKTTKGAARKKDKKNKGKTTSKVPPLKSKARNRPKKDKTTKKTKTPNGTRTGKKPKAQRRLIAAREALIEDYPYVVSIQKDEQHWCTGSLLNPRLVITTANCLWKAKRASRMSVRAGSRHVNRGGQVTGIQEVMKHPGWGLRKSPDNDVALILLDRNVKFTDSVHGVDIPNRVMLPPFDDAWVTSWGSERRDGVYDADSSTLQVYHTRLIERDKCNNQTIRFSVTVTENFICLAQSGRAAPCTRDTGAPAVSDGILWGLASWGIRKLCGTERFPAMFSYLASHSNVDFIVNATRFLMSDKRLYPFIDRFPSVHQPEK